MNYKILCFLIATLMLVGVASAALTVTSFTNVTPTTVEATGAEVYFNTSWTGGLADICGLFWGGSHFILFYNTSSPKVVGFPFDLYGYGPGTYDITSFVKNGSTYYYSSNSITVTIIPDIQHTNFTGTPVSGSTPLSVTFTDLTPASEGPTAWNWSFGDGSYSNSQNPTHTYSHSETTFQRYTVILNTGNTTGLGTKTRTNYINATPAAPISSFTGNVTSGTIDLPVLFTDTSIGNPTIWAWDFGDDGTATTQNPVHTYTVAGKYTVIMTASNAYGAGTTTTSFNYITAIYRPATTKYLISGLVTDKLTGSTVSGVPIILTNVSSAWTANTTSGADGTFYFVDMWDGTYSLNANFLGYNNYIMPGIIVNGADPATLEIELDSTSLVPSSIRYYPHMVRFICKDNMGKTLKNISVEATGFATSSDPAWIKELLGIDLQRVKMDDQVMSARTGADGAAVFLMLEAVQYEMNFTDTTQGVSEQLTLYPSEQTYQVTLDTTATGEIFGAGSSQITRQLSHGQNTTSAIFRLNYNDPTITTTSVKFWVNTSNNTAVWSYTYLGGIVNVTRVETLVHGKAYTYGYEALNPTYGGADGYITGSGAMTTRSRLITIPGLPDVWYSWVVVILLILFVALFSGITNKYGSVFLGLFVLFYWYIGWIDWFPNILDDQGMSFAIMIMLLGALIYISRTYTQVGE